MKFLKYSKEKNKGPKMSIISSEKSKKGMLKKQYLNVGIYICSEATLLPRFHLEDTFQPRIYVWMLNIALAFLYREG